MTRLTIYRGETLIEQVTLTGKTLKLGRSKENDVVLEDPGKGVSRTHAELRPEGAGYRLVDLESQNGIWVSGKRVPSVVLAPGVVAAMGPFRVAIDAESPKTQFYTPIKDGEEVLPDTGTEYSPRVPPPPAAEPGESVPIEGAGALLDAPAAEGTVPPPAASKTIPPPPAKKPTPAVAARTSSAATGSGGGKTGILVLAVVALVVVLGTGFGVYKLMLQRAHPKPVWDSAAATAMVDSGRCQEALDQQITPALNANPNDAQALALKARCSAPPPPPPTTTVPVEPPVKTNAQKLDDADAALQAKSCQAALDTANDVLTSDPNDERAKGIVKAANDCLKPVGQTTSTNTGNEPAVRVPPAQGGLEPNPGENNRDYRARNAAMRKRYDDAMGLLQSQRYQQAVKEFDDLLKQVPVGYLDLAQRRAEARNGVREASNAAYASAQQAEQRGDMNAALERYQRAHDLDPTRDVTAEITHVNQVRTNSGRQLCKEADVAYALNHAAEAAEKYNKVIDLLPAGDECVARAKDRLKQIR